MGKIKTREGHRLITIYELAIMKKPNLDDLDPPATKEEIKEFKEVSKRMREQEAKWEAEGIKGTWYIPDDYC